jgi:hypothetical protein
VQKKMIKNFLSYMEATNDFAEASLKYADKGCAPASVKKYLCSFHAAAENSLNIAAKV